MQTGCAWRGHDLQAGRDGNRKCREAIETRLYNSLIYGTYTFQLNGFKQTFIRPIAVSY